MDKEYEEKVVRTFFVKRLQDRVLFELFSSKKRRDAIWRLCHNSKNTINEKYMVEITKPISSFAEIASSLKKYGADELSYSISLNHDIDGQYLPIAIALEKAVGFGLASIISCIPGKLAYLEEEQSYGAPKRFILYKDKD